MTRRMFAMAMVALAPVLLLAQADDTTPVAPEQRFFHTQRSVAATNTGQSCAPLDADVFAHSAPSLPDLRLYSAAREVPYALHTPAALIKAPAVQPNILNLGRRGSSIAFDASMNAREYSTVELRIDATNFIASAVVSGGQTAGGPHTRLGSYTVFDLTAQKLGRSTVLHLPASNFPWLHFEITGPFKVQDVSGLVIPQIPAREEVFTLVATAGPAAQQSRSTVFSVDISANVPVSRIQFLAPAMPFNFSREVTIQAKTLTASTSGTDGERYPAATSGALRRIHMVHNGDHIDDEHLSLDAFGLAPSPVKTRWTITVDNGDDPPIDWAAVRIEMRQTSLCFDASGAQAYTLMYGDSALSAPRYDYAALFQAEDKPGPATLGVEQPNPQYQSRPDPRPFTEQHPALLWIALVVVILTLGAVALRSGKRMRAP
jgi:hypothetical protein